MWSMNLFASIFFGVLFSFSFCFKSLWMFVSFWAIVEWRAALQMVETRIHNFLNSTLNIRFTPKFNTWHKHGKSWTNFLLFDAVSAVITRVSEDLPSTDRISSSPASRTFCAVWDTSPFQSIIPTIILVNCAKWTKWSMASRPNITAIWNMIVGKHVLFRKVGKLLPFLFVAFSSFSERQCGHIPDTRIFLPIRKRYLCIFLIVLIEEAILKVQFGNTRRGQYNQCSPFIQLFWINFFLFFCCLIFSDAIPMLTTRVIICSAQMSSVTAFHLPFYWYFRRWTFSVKTSWAAYFYRIIYINSALCFS